MANPVKGFEDTKCDGCEKDLSGEALYLTDDGRLCRTCADDNGNVCSCGKFKKPNFDKCYTCFQGKRHG